MNAALNIEPVIDSTHSRDPRTRNHMSPETKAVDDRLDEWGKWSLSDGVPRGYPKTTPMGRAVIEGPHGAGQQSRPPISMPKHIENVDKAVAKLGDIDQRSIMACYKDARGAPIEIIAKVARLPLRRYRNVIKRARWRVSGYLSAFE